MGRKSKLTPDEWSKIERRHLVGGESVNSLAKEFGLNESVVRRRIKPKNSAEAQGKKSLQALAEAKVAADKQVAAIAEEMAELPVVQQNIVADLARKIANTARYLGTAAEHGAATAAHLSGVAAIAAKRIRPDADPDDNTSNLKAVAALTATANDAGKLGVQLMAQHKDAVLAEEEPTADLEAAAELVDLMREALDLKAERAAAMAEEAAKAERRMPARRFEIVEGRAVDPLAPVKAPEEWC